MSDIFTVSYAGRLHAFGPGGEHVWSTTTPADGGYCWHSQPTALDGGYLCLNLAESFAIYNNRGELVEHTLTPNFPHDTSGMSPGITMDGELLFANSLGGEIGVYLNESFRTMGPYGLDVLVPSCYSDCTLGVAGYAGAGFIRITMEGRIIWSSGCKEPDSIVAIGNTDEAMVSSLNSDISSCFSPTGQLLFTVPGAAACAESTEGGWIALSRGFLRKINRDGSLMWSQPIAPPLSTLAQPVVDCEGFSYVYQRQAITCYSPAGEIVFERVILGGAYPGLALVFDKTLVVVGAEAAYIIH